MKELINTLKFDASGLIPAVVQNIETNEVLMVAYMNADTIKQTLETGRATFWSRSRQEVWVKGDTSGNSPFNLYKTNLFHFHQVPILCYIVHTRNYCEYNRNPNKYI